MSRRLPADDYSVSDSTRFDEEREREAAEGEQAEYLPVGRDGSVPPSWWPASP